MPGTDAEGYINAFNVGEGLFFVSPTIEVIFCGTCRNEALHPTVQNLVTHAVDHCDQTPDDIYLNHLQLCAASSIRLLAHSHSHDNFVEWKNSRPHSRLPFTPLPWLSVQQDGWACPHDTCNYVNSTRRYVRDHMRTQHPGSVLPPLQDITVQRYMIKGSNKFFKCSPVQEVHPPDQASLSSLLSAAIDEMQTSRGNVPVAPAAATEPNQFLGIMGFVGHLQGTFTHNQALAVFSQDRLAAVDKWYMAFRSVAYNAIVDMRKHAGQAALMELNRRSPNKDPAEFVHNLQPETLNNYLVPWRKIFAYVMTLAQQHQIPLRRSPQPLDFRLPTRLSTQAVRACRQLSEDLPPTDPQIIDAISDLVFALLDTPLHEDVFESPLLSAMAFMAVDTPDAWKT
ncbi:hypothetical protein CGLO_00636 [Colletotrichum gloeosporioides Cg-14]|uniref:Uncharacterized protein n=1 Tax=Colletotrichum gloeosporioides (strain Cg-14) TaxID=1237896 RepID=T0KU50_COLGC|nr:hypothetical protein CGLO_00636 [Colletotrichum gloeosporioides Cg-14]